MVLDAQEFYYMNIMELVVHVVAKKEMHVRVENVWKGNLECV